MLLFVSPGYLKRFVVIICQDALVILSKVRPRFRKKAMFAAL